MEFIVELLMEIYLELMLLIVPEKNISKKHRAFVKVLAVCAMLLFIGCAIWGIVLITEYDNLRGIVPLSAAVILSLAQIISGFVLYKKNH